VKLKTFLVEDEPDALEHLEALLSLHCGNVTVAGKAGDVKTALVKLPSANPDLVIMDIRLPDGNAFDILNRLNSIKFNVIFTTAYSEYAIKALKISAIDYLLKPIDIQELVQAVQKAEQVIEKETIDLRIKALLSNMTQNAGFQKNIVLTMNGVLHIVNISDIIFCQSINTLTHFFLKDGDEIATSKSILEYEDMLGDYGFFRTSRQFLINIRYLKSFDKTKGSDAIMANGFVIPVSVRRKERLLELIDVL
jgi:two-component system, LytTR family, response regulator